MLLFSWFHDYDDARRFIWLMTIYFMFQLTFFSFLAKVNLFVNKKKNFFSCGYEFFFSISIFIEI